jgi:hypothetical protein
MTTMRSWIRPSIWFVVTLGWAANAVMHAKTAATWTATAATYTAIGQTIAAEACQRAADSEILAVAAFAFVAVMNGVVTGMFIKWSDDDKETDVTALPLATTT